MTDKDEAIEGWANAYIGRIISLNNTGTNRAGFIYDNISTNTCVVISWHLAARKTGVTFVVEVVNDMGETVVSSVYKQLPKAIKEIRI